MSQIIPVQLKLCNEHLTHLYDAIIRGDIKSVYRLEHELTTEEECVACAYALKADGHVREILDTFLQHEGFAVEAPTATSFIEELKYWGVRIGILIAGLLFYFNASLVFKAYILNSRYVNLNSFELAGVFMMTLATLIVLEHWLFE
jgi:hypothetical protein